MEVEEENVGRARVSVRGQVEALAERVRVALLALLRDGAAWPVGLRGALVRQVRTLLVSTEEEAGGGRGQEEGGVPSSSSSPGLVVVLPSVPSGARDAFRRGCSLEDVQVLTTCLALEAGSRLAAGRTVDATDEALHWAVLAWGCDAMGAMEEEAGPGRAGDRRGRGEGEG